ncbi:MAG: hypothetical protein UY67_C0010G0018 [Candidatus Kaiserbacteria bacterium GW2011_GWA2_52_12]|uniref:Uncharacterized protein n=1 Tax=Candidatus Kaiserbacteria bacterium GW2011_GWA2_52_12 TaxID=1618671 RepID=A0A0G1ZWU6_9BACT|nr:MAG: hypothetical protein UY67_C0010G0018 [Candidatus Kaiserbacteria bacterium GW2011_GWA2_52_12]
MCASRTAVFSLAMFVLLFAVPAITYAVGKDANSKCTPWYEECGCGEKPNPDAGEPREPDCIKGVNTNKCPLGICYDDNGDVKGVCTGLNRCTGRMCGGKPCELTKLPPTDPSAREEASLIQGTGGNGSILDQSIFNPESMTWNPPTGEQTAAGSFSDALRQIGGLSGGASEGATPVPTTGVRVPGGVAEIGPPSGSFGEAPPTSEVNGQSFNGEPVPYEYTGYTGFESPPAPSSELPAGITREQVEARMIEMGYSPERRASLTQASEKIVYDNAVQSLIFDKGRPLAVTPSPVTPIPSAQESIVAAARWVGDAVISGYNYLFGGSNVPPPATEPLPQGEWNDVPWTESLPNGEWSDTPWVEPLPSGDWADVPWTEPPPSEPTTPPTPEQTWSEWMAQQLTDYLGTNQFGAEGAPPAPPIDNSQDTAEGAITSTHPAQINPEDLPVNPSRELTPLEKLAAELSVDQTAAQGRLEAEQYWAQKAQTDLRNAEIDLNDARDGVDIASRPVTAAQAQVDKLVAEGKAVVQIDERAELQNLRERAANAEFAPGSEPPLTAAEQQRLRTLEAAESNNALQRVYQATSRDSLPALTQAINNLQQAQAAAQPSINNLNNVVGPQYQQVLADAQTASANYRQAYDDYQRISSEIQTTRENNGINVYNSPTSYTADPSLGKSSGLTPDGGREVTFYGTPREGLQQAQAYQQALAQQALNTAEAQRLAGVMDAARNGDPSAMVEVRQFSRGLEGVQTEIDRLNAQNAEIGKNISDFRTGDKTLDLAAITDIARQPLPAGQQALLDIGENTTNWSDVSNAWKNGDYVGAVANTYANLVGAVVSAPADSLSTMIGNPQNPYVATFCESCALAERVQATVNTAINATMLAPVVVGAVRVADSLVGIAEGVGREAGALMAESSGFSRGIVGDVPFSQLGRGIETGTVFEFRAGPFIVDSETGAITRGIVEQVPVVSSVGTNITAETGGLLNNSWVNSIVDSVLGRAAVGVGVLADPTAVVAMDAARTVQTIVEPVTTALLNPTVLSSAPIITGALEPAVASIIGAEFRALSTAVPFAGLAVPVVSNWSAFAPTEFPNTVASVAYTPASYVSPASPDFASIAPAAPMAPAGITTVSPDGVESWTPTASVPSVVSTEIAPTAPTLASAPAEVAPTAPAAPSTVAVPLPSAPPIIPISGPVSLPTIRVDTVEPEIQNYSPWIRSVSMNYTPWLGGYPYLGSPPAAVLLPTSPAVPGTEPAVSPTNPALSPAAPATVAPSPPAPTVTPSVPSVNAPGSIPSPQAAPVSPSIPAVPLPAPVTPAPAPTTVSPFMAWLKLVPGNLTFNPITPAPAGMNQLMNGWNFGNLNAGVAWEGSVPSIGKQATFVSPYFGARADFLNMERQMSNGNDTLKKLITQLSPPSENKTTKMIAYLSDALGVEPDQKLDFNDKPLIIKLFNEKSFLEHSIRPSSIVNPETIVQAYDAAVAYRAGVPAPPAPALASQLLQTSPAPVLASTPAVPAASNPTKPTVVQTVPASTPITNPIPAPVTPAPAPVSPLTQWLKDLLPKYVFSNPFVSPGLAAEPSVAPAPKWQTGVSSTYSPDSGPAIEGGPNGAYSEKKIIGSSQFSTLDPSKIPPFSIVEISGPNGKSIIRYAGDKGYHPPRVIDLTKSDASLIGCGTNSTCSVSYRILAKQPGVNSTSDATKLGVAGRAAATTRAEQLVAQYSAPSIQPAPTLSSAPAKPVVQNPSVNPTAVKTVPASTPITNPIPAPTRSLGQVVVDGLGVIAQVAARGASPAPVPSAGSLLTNPQRTVIAPETTVPQSITDVEARAQNIIAAARQAYPNITNKELAAQVVFNGLQNSPAFNNLRTNAGIDIFKTRNLTPAQVRSVNGYIAQQVATLQKPIGYPNVPVGAQGRTLVSYPASATSPGAYNSVNNFLWDQIFNSPYAYARIDSTGDFTWKDIAAALNSGRSVRDEVLNMNKELKIALYGAGKAMIADGLKPGGLAFYRDANNRPSVERGPGIVAAAPKNSQHYAGGVGNAADIGSARVVPRPSNLTSAQREANDDARGAENQSVWNWLAKNGSKYNLRANFIGNDPAHVQPAGNSKIYAQQQRQVTADTKLAAAQTQPAPTLVSAQGTPVKTVPASIPTRAPVPVTPTVTPPITTPVVPAVAPATVPAPTPTDAAEMKTTGFVKIANPAIPNGTAAIVIQKGFNPFDTTNPPVIVYHFPGQRQGANSNNEKDLSLGTEQLKDTNTVLVVVELDPRVGASGVSAGNFAKPGVFDAFRNEIAAKAAALYGNPNAINAFKNMKNVMTVYSGGYSSAAAALRTMSNPSVIKEVVLLDALYGNVNDFAQWKKNNPDSILTSYALTTQKNNDALKKQIGNLPNVTFVNLSIAVKNANHYTFVGDQNLLPIKQAVLALNTQTLPTVTAPTLASSPVTVVPTVPASALSTVPVPAPTVAPTPIPVQPLTFAQLQEFGGWGTLVPRPVVPFPRVAPEAIRPFIADTPENTLWLTLGQAPYGGMQFLAPNGARPVAVSYTPTLESPTLPAAPAPTAVAQNQPQETFTERIDRIASNFVNEFMGRVNTPAPAVLPPVNPQAPAQVVTPATPPSTVAAPPVVQPAPAPTLPGAQTDTVALEKQKQDIDTRIASINNELTNNQKQIDAALGIERQVNTMITAARDLAQNPLVPQGDRARLSALIPEVVKAVQVINPLIPSANKPATLDGVVALSGLQGPFNNLKTPSDKIVAIVESLKVPDISQTANKVADLQAARTQIETRLNDANTEKLGAQYALQQVKARKATEEANKRIAALPVIDLTEFLNSNVPVGQQVQAETVGQLIFSLVDPPVGRFLSQYIVAPTPAIPLAETTVAVPETPPPTLASAPASVPVTPAPIISPTPAPVTSPAPAPLTPAPAPAPTPLNPFNQPVIPTPSSRTGGKTTSPASPKPTPEGEGISLEPQQLQLPLNEPAQPPRTPAPAIEPQQLNLPFGEGRQLELPLTGGGGNPSESLTPPTPGSSGWWTAAKMGGNAFRWACFGGWKRSALCASLGIWGYLNLPDITNNQPPSNNPPNNPSTPPGGGGPPPVSPPGGGGPPGVPPNGGGFTPPGSLKLCDVQNSNAPCITSSGQEVTIVPIKQNPSPDLPLGELTPTPTAYQRPPLGGTEPFPIEPITGPRTPPPVTPPPPRPMPYPRYRVAYPVIIGYPSGYRSGYGSPFYMLGQLLGSLFAPGNQNQPTQPPPQVPPNVPPRVATTTTATTSVGVR